jgi:hypothetical protein
MPKQAKPIIPAESAARSVKLGSGMSRVVIVDAYSTTASRKDLPGSSASTNRVEI